MRHRFRHSDYLRDFGHHRSGHTWTNSIGVTTAIPLDTSYVSVGTVGAWIGLLYGGTILSGDAVLNLSYVMGK
jgi:hypothetical protein